MIRSGGSHHNENSISRAIERTRGTLPTALIEEIRVLEQPLVAWDVELARWFDENVLPIEKVGSSTHSNRRQSPSPAVPCALRRTAPPEGRTFGVLLDTWGSEDRLLLPGSLGEIASYRLPG